MSNSIISATNIAVHARGSLSLPFTSSTLALAGRSIWFEVDGIPIREQLVEDPNNEDGLLLVLENEQIVMLKKTDCNFIIRDETDVATGRPIVLWAGKIKKYGFEGAPDNVSDAE